MYYTYYLFSCNSFLCTVEKILDFPCVKVSLKLHDENIPLQQAHSDFDLTFSHFENLYLPWAVGQPSISSPVILDRYPLVSSQGLVGGWGVGGGGVVY